MARHGLLWTYGAGAIGLLTQLGYTMITARMLPHTAFASFAVSQAMVTLFGYLALNAVGAAVARQVRLDADIVGSAWALVLVGGTVAAGVAAAIAPLWARSWHVPGAAPLILLSLPTILLAPATVLALALLRQRLRFRAAALAEAAGATTGIVVAGALVVRTQEAVFLPVSLLVATVVSGTAACVAGGVVPRPRWHAARVAELLSFVRRISVLNLGYAVLLMAPQIVVSRGFGPLALAWFSRANMLVTLPQQQASAGLMKVLYPLFSRVRDDPGALRRAVTAVLVMASGAALPFGMLAGLAGPAVAILLGPGWEPAAAMVPVLCAWACAYLVMALASNIFESGGALRRIWSTQVVTAVGLTAPILVLAVSDELTVHRALTVSALAVVVAHAWQLRCFMAAGSLDLRRVLRAYSVHGLAGVLAFVVLRNTASVVGPWGWQLEYGALALVVATIVVAAWLPRRWIPLWTTAGSLGLLRSSGRGSEVSVS